MEQLTTYRAKGKEIGLVFLFKYDLKGNLKAFEISEGELTTIQQDWLFNVEHFPSNEIKMQYWAKSKSFTKIFDVELSPADLSFNAMWNLYDYKESRKDAETQFNKLKEADIIKCFVQIPKYKKKIALTGIAQALLATWLNKQRFNDEY